MTSLNYCTKCVLPTTRPNLSLDENGVCSACNSTTSKSSVNWEHRKKAFMSLIDEIVYNAPLIV